MRKQHTIADLVESSGFQLTIFAVIVFAAVLVGLETYPALADAHPLFFEVANAVVLWIFTVEIALRILACGRKPWRFLLSGWNLFDLAIVIVLLLPMQSGVFSVLRLVRIVRLLRIARTVRVLRLIDLPQMRFVVNALLKSLPSIGSIAMLLSLHFYIYAVIGTTLFHDIDPAHFGTLQVSVLSLFTTLTLEQWVQLMERQHAVGALGQQVPMPVVAAFFVSFIVIGTMIVMNLLIGAIVNTMGEQQDEEEEAKVLAKRGKRALTVHQELSAIEKQLDESAVCLRMLKKTLTAEGVDLDVAPAAVAQD